MNTRPVFHGSDIEKICDYYKLDPKSIVNFGANVNPLGFPETVRLAVSEHLDILSSYPDRSYQSLRNLLGNLYHVPADFVLPGNGSSELITLLIETLRPDRALILGPTYSEYSRELSLLGSTQEIFDLKESENFQLNTEHLFARLEESFDLFILCNPNNPTSTAVPACVLEEILTFCRSRNIFVMIDETYIEFADDPEALSAASLTEKFSNLIVLRGVSKFFAAPGLRFGYGITGSPRILDSIRMRQIPWSLNSIGAFAGELLFQDTGFIKITRELILQERRRIYQHLEHISYLKTWYPSGNFFLVRLQKPGLTSFDVFERCIQNGLMIRDCSSFEGLNGEYIRFCIMLPEDNSRLLDILESY